MEIKKLTNQQHQNVLAKLAVLAKSTEIRQFHSAGKEYTSLMVCFLMHSMTAADCILQLHKFYGEDSFPSTVGYNIVRPMFEIDVIAHYISKEPSARARLYIEYGTYLKNKEMTAWENLRSSDKPDWQEAANTILQHVGAYTRKKGKHKSWSGKNLRQMAKEVDHEEAYDIFYADLSSFTHADVRLADRFLSLSSNGMSWSTGAIYQDVGGVFLYADIFLTCFLKLFGQEFNTWQEDDVQKCWD